MTEQRAAILDGMGKVGVALIQSKIEPYDATRKTRDSIRYESTENRLRIFARKFIEAIETGRGPRKSSQQGDFKDNMLEYMKARGIGADLEPKKREQLARFLTWKINKEGDKTFKAGGRQVYSDALAKFVEELKKAVVGDFKKSFINSLKIQ